MNKQKKKKQKGISTIRAYFSCYVLIKVKFIRKQLKVRNMDFVNVKNPHLQTQALKTRCHYILHNIKFCIISDIDLCFLRSMLTIVRFIA